MDDLYDIALRNDPDGPMVDMAAVRKFLLEVADYIEVNGWTQYMAETMTGEVCVGGAARRLSQRVERETGHADPRYGTAMLYLAQQFGVHVTAWNDQQGMTKDEVLGTLRALGSQ